MDAENKLNSTSNDITISVDAERSVLGAILVNNDTIIPVSSVIKAEDFYEEAHRIIYTAMLDVYTKSMPIDLIVLSEQIKTMTNIEEIGGAGYITSLSTNVDFSKNAEYYARIVKEKSDLRRVIKSSNEVIGYAMSGKDIEDVLELAEQNIFNISQDKTNRGFSSIKEVLNLTYDTIEQNYKNKGRLTGIDTGFADLNYITNGLQKTDLILVAARPATGKTAFALNLAMNAAKKGGSVAVFSLEMSKTQLAQRILSATSKVEMKNIKSGDISEDEWKNLIDGISMMNDYKIEIDDDAGINVTAIRSLCRKLKMQKGLDLVVIDYLQLMQGSTKTENRQQEISNISRNLKILAKELDCPVIALSQLSRAPEQRTNHRPMLSDLRESGAIEQDADVVMFLYRDEIYDPDTDKKGITEVILAKHRNGEIGTVELKWLGKYQLFADLAKFF